MAKDHMMNGELNIIHITRDFGDPFQFSLRYQIVCSIASVIFLKNIHQPYGN